jgi:hypothetical protein
LLGLFQARIGSPKEGFVGLLDLVITHCGNQFGVQQQVLLPQFAHPIPETFPSAHEGIMRGFDEASASVVSIAADEFSIIKLLYDQCYTLILYLNVVNKFSEKYPPPRHFPSRQSHHAEHESAHRIAMSLVGHSCKHFLCLVAQGTAHPTDGLVMAAFYFAVFD